MTLINLVLKRMRNNSRLLAVVFSGILAAITLISAAPIYLSAMEKQNIRVAIDKAAERNASSPYLNLNFKAPFVPLDSEFFYEVEESVYSSVPRVFDRSIIEKGRHIRSSFFTFFIYPPIDHTISPRTTFNNFGETEPRFIEGYFQNLADLEFHVTYVSGRHPRNSVDGLTNATLFESSLSSELSDKLGITLGDIISAAPSPESSEKIETKVVGIFEPRFVEDLFWQGDHNNFLYRYPPFEEEGTEPEFPFLSLFVTEKSLIEGIGETYPGSFSDVVWYNQIDNQLIREWSLGDLESAVDAVSKTIGKAVQGAEFQSEIKMVLRELGENNLRNNVPLLILMSVLSVGLIYFLFLLTAYMVYGRQSDIALLRSRGLSTLHLLGQYSLEGLFLIGIAVIAGPLIAMGLISSLGVLPYFLIVTGGSFLPIGFSLTPFIVAACVGIICLFIFIFPVLAGSGSHQITRRIAISRPPTIPLIQRYYVDVLFLVVVGILFWELKVRGQISAGGLYGQQGVNEALLVAPAILLIAVAMIFFRVFPMIVRFFAGESPVFIVLIGWISVLFSFGSFLTKVTLDNSDVSVLVICSFLCFAAGLYWFGRSEKLFVVGTCITLVTLGLFGAWIFRPDDFPFVLLLGFWGMSIVLPGMAIFYLIRYLSQFNPVWATLPLWHMSRNPLQYSWLVILLVISSGIAVLSATLGATLEKSHYDRVKYAVAGDARIVSTVGTGFFGLDSTEELSNSYLTVDGVISATSAIRREGSLGEGPSPLPFTLLAIESDVFVPWSRDDFSHEPIPVILDSLRADNDQGPPFLPEGATDVGVKLKPSALYPLMSIWMQVMDASGERTIITFGRSGDSKWSNRSVSLEKYQLTDPVKVISIQISEPGSGDVGTPGTIFFDDIYAIKDGREIVIESFEHPAKWTIIPTAPVSSDTLTFSNSAAISGESGAVFEFAKETNLGIRGIYWAGSGNSLPVVVSDTFLHATGLNIGSTFFADISGVKVVMLIVDEIKYFPTLDPSDSGFVVADVNLLESQLGVVNSRSTESRNEIFLNLDSSYERTSDIFNDDRGTRTDTIDEIDRMTGFGRELMESTSMFDQSQINPLVTAGWKAMTLVATFTAVFMTSMGYFVYVIFLSRRAHFEMGLIRFLGLSRIQVLSVLSLENFAIFIMGLGLGSWTGFQMTRFIIQFVVVSEEGRQMLPPAVFVTDWWLLGVAFMAFGVVFSVCIAWLSSYLSTIHLGALARDSE